MIKRLAFALALTASLSFGCHKKEASPSPGSQSQGTSSAQAEAKPMAGEVDPNLTAALRQFVQKNGRLPKTFREFVRNSLDSNPPAPEGKKWEIDPADTTIKAVPK